MPDQPSQTIRPDAEPLSDAEAMAWLDGLVIRGLACAAGLLVAFVLAAIPLPYLWGRTLALMVIDIFVKPSPAHLEYVPPPDSGFWMYWNVCLWLTLILSHPVLLKHALDITTPLRIPERQRRLRLVLLASLVSFLVGLVAWMTYFLALHLWFIMSWKPSGIVALWYFSDYVETMTSVVVTGGFAFELPALISGAVRLRISTPDRLARWRPCAVLLAFVVAGFVTPTPDPLNQAIVAVPICLLYELGLLLARRVPAESTLSTVK